MSDSPLSISSLSAYGVTPPVLGLGGVCVVLIVAIVVLIVRQSGARKKRHGETREIVGVIEDLRSGHTEGLLALGPESELAVLGDAVDRLVRANREAMAKPEPAPPVEPPRATSEVGQEVAVIATDMDGDIREFSRGAAILLGYDDDQVLGRPVAMLFDEAAFRDFLPKMARRSVRETGVTARATLLRKDRSSLECDLSVRVLPGGGFAIIVHDATEQARLERSLRDSEQRYRGLIEALADGVAIVQDGSIAYANPAFCVLAGRDDRDLLGGTFRDLVTTTDVLPVAAAVQSAEAEGVGSTLDVTLADVDERPAPRVQLEVCAIAHEGRPAALVLARDATRETRLARALQQHEARLDAVLEASPDGILVLASTGTGRLVQMTNRAFVEGFGLELDDVLGRGEATLRERLVAIGGGAERVAAVLARANGTPQNERVTFGGREIEISVVPFTDRAGLPVGRLVAFRDRTEEHRSETDLQEFAERVQLGKAELEQAYVRLEEMNRDVQGRADRMQALNVELRRLNQMKSVLLGNVSHELQTPLVSIRGYTEMILKGRLGPVSDEQRRGLSTSLTNIDRLIGMIDGLLAFSRSETELGRLHLTRFPLEALIGEVVELLQPKIAARSVRFENAVDNGLEIYADREKTFRVFVNLLSNAVKFNRPGGEVKVIARTASRDRVTVSIEDTGLGIARNAQEHIFDRHYRGEPGETPDEEGSGIGLAIVRDILRLHGCRIQVESEEGSGTTFSFQLPLAVTDADDALDEPSD